MNRFESIVYGIAMTLISVTLGGLGVALIVYGVNGMPRSASLWLGAVVLVGASVGLHSAYDMVSPDA